MLDATRHDETLTGPEYDRMAAKLNGELTAPNEEKLVLILVVMPGESSLDLHNLDFLPIELGDGFGAPMLVEQREFLVEIDLVHVPPLFVAIARWGPAGRAYASQRLRRL